jgi:Glycosyltransferase family 87
MALRLQTGSEETCIGWKMTATTNLAKQTETRDRPLGPLLPIAILAVCVLLAVLVFALSHPIHDFVEYWTVGHLLVAHHNPYSLSEVFRMERAAGFEQSVPIMLLSPPWTLPLIAPLGLAASYSLAWIGWIVVLMLAVGISSRLIMDVYFGELRIPEISDTAFYRSLFAFTFYPVLLCLRYAQTAPLMLLGLSSFLYFEKKDRPFLAGAFLSLTLVKPQLLYLVWLALIFRSFQQRRWGVLFGAAVSTTLLSAVALFLDPHVFQQYRELTASPYMQAYASGVTAGIRKLFGGVGTFWIQLVPPVFGMAWFVRYWRKNHEGWSWTENLPMLLTMSVVTSAYGWLFDQTLLALPIIALAAGRAHAIGRLPFSLVALYTALNCVLMMVMPFPTLNLLPAPIFIAVLLLRKSKSKQSATVSSHLELCTE